MSTQPNMTRWDETEEERAIVEGILARLYCKGLFVTTDQERAALIAEYFGIDLEALGEEHHRALARQAEMLAQLGYSSIEYDTWEGWVTGWMVFDARTQTRHGGPYPRSRASYLARKLSEQDRLSHG